MWINSFSLFLFSRRTPRRCIAIGITSVVKLDLDRRALRLRCFAFASVRKLVLTVPMNSSSTLKMSENRECSHRGMNPEKWLYN